MTRGGPPFDEWGDDDEIEDCADSGLDDVETYGGSFRHSDEDGSSSIESGEPSTGDSMVQTLSVTATNPARTVSATALLDGRVTEIRLEPRVARLSETELAEQIAMVARLANHQGRATQHAFTALFMQQLGHDASGTRSFLERTIGLPSPNTVLEEKAAMFRDHTIADE